MQTPAAAPTERPRRFRSFVLTLFLLALAFGAGYVPKEMELRRANDRLTKLELDHRLSELHRALGVASHEAMRSNYASAAEAARAFFDGCSEVTQTQPFTDEPRTRIALTAYAGERNQVLAQLAAGDPAARERLAGLFLTMNGVLARRE